MECDSCMIKGKFAIYTCLLLVCIQNSLLTLANKDSLTPDIKYPSLIYVTVISFLLDAIIFKYRNTVHCIFITLVSLVYKYNIEGIASKFIIDAFMPVTFFMLKDKVFYETIIDTLRTQAEVYSYAPSIVTGINLMYVLYWKLSLYDFNRGVTVLALTTTIGLSTMKYFITPSSYTVYSYQKLKRKMNISNGIQSCIVGYLWGTFAKYVDFSAIYRIDEFVYEINKSLFYCTVCVLAAAQCIHQFKNIYILCFSSSVCALILTVMKIWYFPYNELATIFFSIVLLVHDIQKNMMYIRYDSYCLKVSIGYDLIAFSTGMFINNLFTLSTVIQNGIDITLSVLWILTSFISLKYHRKNSHMELCETEACIEI